MLDTSYLNLYSVSRNHCANNRFETFSLLVDGPGVLSDLTEGRAAGSGVDTETVDSGAGVEATCAFALVLFLCGAPPPAALRSSAKLNFRKLSRRSRSGAACTSPVKPKYAVPL